MLESWQAKRQDGSHRPPYFQGLRFTRSGLVTFAYETFPHALSPLFAWTAQDRDAGREDGGAGRILVCLAAFSWPEWFGNRARFRGPYSVVRPISPPSSLTRTFLRLPWFFPVIITILFFPVRQDD